MTADEVRALPAVVDLTTAARVLGLGRSAAYERWYGRAPGQHPCCA